MKMKALVVEDNPVNQIVATKMLKHFGFDVEIASDGKAAVEFLETHDVDVVFMDCQMPTMSGYEATRTIRTSEVAKGKKRVPIVAMTAHANVADKDKCFESGMDMYLSKPIVISVLDDAIKKLLPR